WTPTTSIANTAVTAPDKNAAMTNKTTVEAISGLRFRHLIGRSASRGSPFPGPGKSGDRDGRAQERGEPIIPCYRRCYGRRKAWAALRWRTPIEPGNERLGRWQRCRELAELSRVRVRSSSRMGGLQYPLRSVASALATNVHRVG